MKKRALPLYSVKERSKICSADGKVLGQFPYLFIAKTFAAFHPVTASVSHEEPKDLLESSMHRIKKCSRAI